MLPMFMAGNPMAAVASMRDKTDFITAYSVGASMRLAIEQQA